MSLNKNNMETGVYLCQDEKKENLRTEEKKNANALDTNTNGSAEGIGNTLGDTNDGAKSPKRNNAE